MFSPEQLEQLGDLKPRDGVEVVHARIDAPERKKRSVARSRPKKRTSNDRLDWSECAPVAYRGADPWSAIPYKVERESAGRYVGPRRERERSVYNATYGRFANA